MSLQTLQKLDRLVLELKELHDTQGTNTIKQQQPPRRALQEGDSTILLMTGVHCQKRDIAKVRKIKNNMVHFIVNRNKVQSYKKICNVKRVVKKENEQQY